MRSLLSTFFAILLIPFALWATEYNHAYLVITSFGPGTGMMGHGFLVFTPTPGNFLGGEAYQYNLEINIHDDTLLNIKDPFAILNAIKYGHFVSSRSKAFAYMERERRANRAQFLYKLKLSKREIFTLVTNLNEEMKERQIHPLNDYDIFKNNCLTKIIDQINAVVRDQREIATIWNSREATLLDYFSVDKLSADAPVLFAEVLARSPIVEKLSIIKPISYNQLNSNLVIAGDTDRLNELCHFTSDEYKFIWSANLNMTIRESKSYLAYFQNKISSCHLREAFDNYNEIIMLMERLSTGPKRFRPYYLD